MFSENINAQLIIVYAHRPIIQGEEDEMVLNLLSSDFFIMSINCNKWVCMYYDVNIKKSYTLW